MDKAAIKSLLHKPSSLAAIEEELQDCEDQETDQDIETDEGFLKLLGRQAATQYPCYSKVQTGVCTKKVCPFSHDKLLVEERRDRLLKQLEQVQHGFPVVKNKQET